MVCDSTKRIVIIRNIPSNFIEEAILILKTGGSTKENKDTASDKTDKRPAAGENDFLVKEAQLIIENYVKENKLQAAARREKELKGSFLNRFLKANMFINLLLAGGLILLVFLITKLF